MTFPTFWRGPREARFWYFAVALIVSVAIHLPLTPLAVVVRLLGLSLDRASSDWDYKDDTVVVPISFDVEPAPAAEPAAPAPAAPEVAAGPPARSTAEPLPATPSPANAKRRNPLHSAARDGGVRAPAAAASTRVASRDAGVRAWFDSGAPEHESGRPATDGGVEAGAVAAAANGPDGSAPIAGLGGDAGARSLADKLGLGGAIDKTTKAKANIVLALWFTELRSHPLGRRLGDMLGCIPQWRAFLGSQVDAMDECDAVMLSGPQFMDTSKVTAMIALRGDRERARGLIAGLVARSGARGRFLEDAPSGELAARFYADRADRIAATHRRDLLFLTPPEGYEQIKRIHEPLSMPPSHGRALALTLLDPWRPARRVGLSLPRSISELRVEIRPTADGGADLHAEADDADAASAERDAAAVHDQLAPFAFFIGQVPVTTDGGRIVITTHLSRMTSALLLGMVEGQLCPAGFDGGRGGAPPARMP